MSNFNQGDTAVLREHTFATVCLQTWDRIRNLCLSNEM